MATIRKLRGKWQAMVRRKGVAPRCKSFDKKSDAEKWARDLESQVDSCGFLPDTRPAEQTTLGDILKRYRDEVSPMKRSAKTEIIRLNAMLRRDVCHRMQKCEALEISRFDQPELVCLRSDEMRDQMNALMARYVRTERDIRSLAKRDRYAKGNEGSWARIWGAAEWLKLRSPAGYQISPKDLAEAYVAFGGTDIKPPSAVKKLLSVRKLLGAPPEPHLAISSDAPEKPLKSTLDAATPHNASTSPT